MRKTIQELTGLRGVAALLILIGHSVGVAPVLKNWPTAPLMNVLTLCGMSVFFILSGIVICYNYQAASLGVIFATALIALMALRIVDFDGCRTLLASPCMVALCFAVFVFGSKILRSRPLGFMGDVSYSTYLIHPFFGYLLSFFGNPPSLTIPNLLVHFGLTYLTAWGVYKLYEVPMRRKIRAFFA